MIVHRIAKWQYLEDITGTGARLYGGRWNREGYPLLYTSSNLSLAVLELLANNVRKLIDDTYGYISIEIPDLNIAILNTSDLNTDWRNAPYSEQTINMGTDWIKGGSSLALSVPSAALKQEQNLLINPIHPEFSLIKIVEKKKLELDGRVG